MYTPEQAGKVIFERDLEIGRLRKSLQDITRMASKSGNDELWLDNIHAEAIEALDPTPAR